MPVSAEQVIAMIRMGHSCRGCRHDSQGAEELTDLVEYCEHEKEDGHPELDVLRIGICDKCGYVFGLDWEP
jgi:hypothetical protein